MSIQNGHEISIQNGHEISIQKGNCPCMHEKSPFGMGLSMREWEISILGALFQQALAPSGLAGMDGAVASLRRDAFECEDGRRAVSASATRPSTACYRVIYY
jgi:hypothetical protein